MKNLLNKIIYIALISLHSPWVFAADEYEKFVLHRVENDNQEQLIAQFDEALHEEDEELAARIKKLEQEFESAKKGKKVELEAKNRQKSAENLQKQSQIYIKDDKAVVSANAQAENIRAQVDRDSQVSKQAAKQVATSQIVPVNAPVGVAAPTPPTPKNNALAQPQILQIIVPVAVENKIEIKSEQNPQVNIKTKVGQLNPNNVKIAQNKPEISQLKPEVKSVLKQERALLPQKVKPQIKAELKQEKASSSKKEISQPKPEARLEPKQEKASLPQVKAALNQEKTPPSKKEKSQLKQEIGDLKKKILEKEQRLQNQIAESIKQDEEREKLALANQKRAQEEERAQVEQQAKIDAEDKAKKALALRQARADKVAAKKAEEIAKKDEATKLQLQSNQKAPAAPKVSQLQNSQNLNLQLQKQGPIKHYLVRKGESLNVVAKKFNLGIKELMLANPQIFNPKLVHEGTTLVLPISRIVPNVAAKGVVINLAEPRLYYFGKGEEIKTFPITIGRDGLNTPIGKTVIARKRKDPPWIPPQSIKLENPALPDIVPAGPNNPLGQYALDLDASKNRKWQRIIIHGTNNPWGIGANESHGCIRLYPKDIEALFGEIEVGEEVTIVDQPIKVAEIDNKVYIEVHFGDDGFGSITDSKKFICNVVNKCDAKLNWVEVEKALIENSGIPALVSL